MKTAKKLFLGVLLVVSLMTATGCSRMRHNVNNTTERIIEHNNNMNSVTEGGNRETGLLEKVGDDIRDDIENGVNRNRETEIIR
jgi:hypothetical protein